jgi:nucleotide-binding universal stress UspA family protein
MFHKILVPLDGSEAAEAALKTATYLSSMSDGEIELVRVQSLPPQFGFTSEADLPQAYYDEERELCLAYLEPIADRLRQAGRKVLCTVPKGPDCAKSILEAAVRSASDLIVLTSHGRTGLSKVLLGSVAESVSRRAPCPVMIIGEHAPPEA